VLHSIDKLIVAEKHSVAKAFAKALAGREIKPKLFKQIPYYLLNLNHATWAIIGLRGHIMDFDFGKHLENWRSIDPRELFNIPPKMVIREESKAYADLLKELGRYAEAVYLALDGDSEGESIAFEVMNIIRSVNPYAEFKRLWFSDTLPSTLTSALNNPRTPNKNLADKCFARMEIDLTIGAAFTRLLTLSIEDISRKAFPPGHFISYGPCQTPVLYLVVQRDREREKFKAQKFYRVVAKIEVNGEVYEVEHRKRRFATREEAESAAQAAKKSLQAYIEDLREEVHIKSPPLPLNTVDLESRASKYLNLRSKTTLDTAEKLYQLGLISYPRTETQIYPEALNLQQLVEKLSKIPIYREYAIKLLRQQVKPTKGSKDDRAHPPIHPVTAVDERVIKAKLGSNAWKIYDLIVRHFLATLSPPAKFLSQTAVIDIGGEKFVAHGLKPISLGFLEIYDYEMPTERALNFRKGDIARVLEVSVREGQTEPPPYLSESELLKLMEKLGIGTDATAPQHIQTNIDRGYFYIENKRCIPTPLGKALINMLEQARPELVKPEVRALIEKKIEQVAKGEKRREEVVREAKEIFLSYYDDVKRRIPIISRSLLPTLSISYKMRDEKISKRRSRVIKKAK